MTTPIAERAYARPELLAESTWLADHLAGPRIRIVDARSEGEYTAGHIAGAVHLDGFGNLPRDEKGDMGSADEFARLVGSLGISNEDTVVVYDTPTQRMGMVAWSFMYYGHADVRILDGGVAKWLAEARPLVTEPTEFRAANYVAKPTTGVYCSLDQAKSGKSDDSLIFWDTRSADEYDGKATGFGAAARPGRIPGAVHLEWTELLDSGSRTFKPAADLREMLESRGITPDKRIASYCNGGARGALAAFVLQVLGYHRAQAYAGSFQQWSNQPDTAVER